MDRLLSSVAVAALLAAAAPADAQIGVRASTSEAEPSQESVVVQGQRKEIAQALRKLITETQTDQMARFESTVCPIVIGMPRDWTATLTRMISENITAVGGKIGKPGCSVNAAVIFIDQPLDLIKALAKEEPGFFNKTPRELDLFTAEQRPVASWHVTDTFSRDGVEMGQMMALGGMPADAKVNRQYGVSRLYTSVRDEMLVAFVVIDRQQTPGKSLRQLADLATMHLLLDVNQEAGARDPVSILSLF